MENIVPMFHMDEQSMWRWYLTSGGVALAVSLRSFFYYEDARRNYEDAMRIAA